MIQEVALSPERRRSRLELFPLFSVVGRGVGRREERRPTPAYQLRTLSVPVAPSAMHSRSDPVTSLI